jgi:hypothetical protein
MLFCDYQAHFTKTRCKVRSLSRPPVKRMRVDSGSRSRSMSRPPRDEMGIKDSVVSISEYCKVPIYFPVLQSKLQVVAIKYFQLVSSWCLTKQSYLKTGAKEVLLLRVYSCLSLSPPPPPLSLFFLWWQYAHLWNTHTSSLFTEGSNIPIMIYMYSRNQFTCHCMLTKYWEAPFSFPCSS